MKRLIDLHCDTISELQKRGDEETLLENQLCVHMEALKRAGTMVQFFACFADGKEYEDGKTVWNGRHRQIGPEAWDRAYKAVLDMIRRIRKEEQEGLVVVESYDEILENDRQHRITAVATVEEGGVLNEKQERLEELYRLGIRLITLTWNYENCLGYPNSRDGEVMNRGLKAFGLEIVERMNALGMLVDVSHLSDGGFWDCIRVSRAPIIASHSNARALCGVPRNLTDDMLRALAEKGARQD